MVEQGRCWLEFRFGGLENVQDKAADIAPKRSQCSSSLDTVSAGSSSTANVQTGFAEVH